MHSTRLLAKLTISVKDRMELLTYLLVVVFTIILSNELVRRYYAFDYVAAYDFGVFEQSLWTTVNYGFVNGQIFWNTCNFGHLHIHFDPILFFLLPIYAAFQSPITLLVLESFFIGLGALPIYWLARDEWNDSKASFLLAVTYLLYGPLLGIAWGFYPDTMIPAFLLFSCYYFKKRRWGRYFIFLILFLMCKDIITSLFSFFFGFSGLWDNRDKILKSKGVKAMLRDRAILYSIVTVALSVLWLLLSQSVMSYYTSISLWALESKESTHLLWWTDFGNDIGSIILEIITNPIHTLQVLKTNLFKIQSWSTIASSFPTYFYLITLFTPLALVPLLSPTALMTAVPYIFWFLISNNPIYWRFRLQYVAPIVPFIFISTIYGAKKLSKLQVRLTRQMIYVGAGTKIKPKCLRAIMIIIFLTNIMSVSFPLEGVDNYWFLGERTIGTWSMTLHRQAMQEVVDLVPANASILTHNNIFPHVCHRLQVYPGWRSDLPECDYILVDSTLYWSFVRPSTIDWKYEATTGSKLEEIWSTGNYSVVTAVDGIWLWKKGLSQDVSLKEIIAPGGHGLMARFYNNTEFIGEPVFNSVFLELGPSLYRFSTDWETVIFPESTSLNKYWQMEIRPHVNLPSLFSANFSGFLYVPTAGNYTFQSNGRGNLILSLDDKVLIIQGEATYLAQFILLNTLDNVDTKAVVDNNASNWVGFAWGQGSIGIPDIEDSPSTTEKGISPEINVGSGTYAHWCIFHVFTPALNMSDADFISFWWYGNNSQGRIAVKLNAPDDNNFYYQTFIDSSTGWRQIVLPLKSFIKVGSPQGWSEINRILIHSVDENINGTWQINNLVMGKGIQLIPEMSNGILGDQASVQLEAGYHKFEILFVSYEEESSIWINWMPPWKKSLEVLPGENLYLLPS